MLYSILVWLFFVFDIRTSDDRVIESLSNIGVCRERSNYVFKKTAVNS